MTFAPMTAAAMREVPPRIAGSASGIINTTRNIGQVLGIAVMGTVLQTRMDVHATDRLASIPMDDGLRAQIIDAVSGSRFELIPQILTGGLSSLLAPVTSAVQLAFVDSLHDTFLIGAVACAVGACCALLIHNVVTPQAVPQQEPAIEEVVERELVPAD